MSNDKQLPATLQHRSRAELLAQIKNAGANNLSTEQTAQYLGINIYECQSLMSQYPEFSLAYTTAQLEQHLMYLGVLKEVANDPDPNNKQRFPAAKYLYELFSGNKQQNNTFIAIQNIAPEHARLRNNIKLVEALDAETVEKISND